MGNVGYIISRHNFIPKFSSNRFKNEKTPKRSPSPAYPASPYVPYIPYAPLPATRVPVNP